MRSLTILAAVLALSLGVFASPVLAGGWAVTTFDEMPGQFVSGQEYKLGYTIRQHGVTAISVDKTEILAVAVTVGPSPSPAPAGDVGHYVATVFSRWRDLHRKARRACSRRGLGKIHDRPADGRADDKAKAADKTDADKAQQTRESGDKRLRRQNRAADKVAAADKAAAATKLRREQGESADRPQSPATPCESPAAAPSRRPPNQ